MSHITIDIQNIYRQYFAKPYVAAKQTDNKADSASYRIKVGKDTNMSGDGFWFADRYNGIDVMMPVTLYSGKTELFIPCSTISCTRRNTIIRTAVAEREGTVKEQFAAGDWIITLKGVLGVGASSFPKDDTETLIEMSKNIEPLELWCGLTDLFMPGNNKVIVESLDFPELQGSNIRHRPFSMTMESDYIDNLEVVKN